MNKIARPPWYIDYYKDQRGRLNLSNNVCYDKVLIKELEFGIDYSKLFQYPDASHIYNILGDYHSVDVQNIAIGFGAGDIIYRLFNFLRKHSILIHTPTYELAYVFAVNLGLNVITTDDINQFSADVQYISNPNGITGVALTKQEILELSTKCKYLIVDEAYGDFATIDCSVLSECVNNNIIIIKTLSKSIASPGLRFGYCISNKTFINDFQNERSSTVITGLTTDVVNKLLDNIPGHVARMLETRNYIESKYKCVKSQGNFVLLVDDLNLNCLTKKTCQGLYRMALTDIDTFIKLENDSNSK